MADQRKPGAFTVRVPATTANLGAGFDCLGLALNLYNIIHVEVAQALGVSITGEGASSLPADQTNCVVQAMRHACDACGWRLPPVRLTMHNTIPLARGLGSSAAAAVGGLLVANHLYEDRLGCGELLKLATELEGHPDNVAPALEGGLCVVAVDDGKPMAVKIPWPANLHIIVYAPDATLSTPEARAALPSTVSRADAVFNISRAALWPAALTQGRFDLLRLATQDRLHQPYRAGLIAGFDSILAAAHQAGARGAFLSGAGSSLAAIADTGTERIAAAMQDAAKAAGHTGRAFVLDCDSGGATIESA